MVSLDVQLGYDARFVTVKLT